MSSTSSKSALDLLQQLQTEDTSSEENTDQQQSLTTDQKAVLAASVVAGCSIRKKSDNTASFVQNSQNRQWVEWKGSVLEPHTSSVVSDDVNGHRVMTKASSLFYPYRQFYSSSSNELNRRRVEDSLVRSVTDNPLFLLVWFVDSKKWLFRGFDVHIPVLKEYTGADLERLCKALRSFGFSSVRHDVDNQEVVIEQGGPQLVNLLEDTAREQDLDFVVESLPSELKPRNKADIDPEKAKYLNQVKGVTFSEMERVFGVPQTTCWRRAKSCDKDFDGDDHHDLSMVCEILSEMDHEGWSDKQEGEQQEMVDRAVSLLMKVPFPYPNQRDDSEKIERFQSLVDLDLKLTDEGEIRPNSLWGLELCRPFFSNRYNARHSESKLSCRQAWENPDELERAVRFQLRYGDPLVPRRVRRALQTNLRTPTLFKPAQAKFICDTYGKPHGTYWDPCAGYGGRLLGAMASGMNYIGTDVDKNTVSGNRELYSNLQRLELVDGLEAEVVHQQAEEFDPERPLDLVFTSPPYFDREQYSSEEGQSYIQHGSSVGDWIEGFLKPIVETAYDRLEEDGFLVINIADLNDQSETKKTVPLVDRTIECAVDVGFIHQNTLRMPLSNLSSRGYEPVLVFGK